MSIRLEKINAFFRDDEKIFFKTNKNILNFYRNF